MYTITRALPANPVVRDRLKALAVFTGIAIGGVSGLELVISGGLDPLTPRFAYEAAAPRHWYDRDLPAEPSWTAGPFPIRATFTPTSTTLEPQDDMYKSSAMPVAGELAGGPTEATAKDGVPPMQVEAPSPAPQASAAAFDDQGYERAMAEVEAMVAQALSGADKLIPEPLPSGTASPS